jgi:predicted secreted protein
MRDKCMGTRSVLLVVGRVAIIAAVLWVAVTTVIGAQTDPVVNEVRQEILLTEQDSGRTIDLREDQVLVISLLSIPGTGYQWQPVLLDDRVVRHDQSSPVSHVSSSGNLGEQRYQLLRFLAMGEGETDLRLEYRRPWEGTASDRVFEAHIRTVGDFVGINVATPTAAPSPPASTETPAISTLADEPGALPAAYNWCDLGGCTPVRDQKSCGSCWAFATVGVLESAIKRADGVSRDVSEQYLVSCNTEGWGCSGGLWAHSYHINEIPPGELAAGAVYETDFPYVATDAACNAPHTHHERLLSWEYVGVSYGIPAVSEIKQAIYDHGPVAVAICAGSGFSSYTGGVMTHNDSAECGWSQIDHAVILVGWNDSDGAWILRNSWGSSWGENGYMRIKYGISNVGYGANYVTYEESTPDPTPVPTSVPPFEVSSSVYLPVVLAGGDASIFRNGGFEDGASEWLQYSVQGYDLILPSTGLPVAPYQGAWAAWLGGANNEVSYIEQEVSIPPSGAVLGFWHAIYSDDLCGYDYGVVVVRSGSDLVAVDVYDLCALTATGGWELHTVDLSAYAGQTVGLQLRVETDSSCSSSVFVDNVSFSGWAAEQPAANRTPVAAWAPEKSAHNPNRLSIISNATASRLVNVPSSMALKKH